jgi:hypothetical protein
VSLLRRVLYLHAIVWVACGLAVALAPRFVLERVFDQVYPDVGYVRVSGVLGIALALHMVLVAQRLEDHWWWSWTFVIADAGLVVVTLASALVGVPAETSAALWWVFAGTSLVLGAGLVAGLAKAGTERSTV